MGRRQAEERYRPAYLKLAAEGTLSERVRQGLEALKSCRLCPRGCGVNRLADERGFCRTGRYASVSSALSHFGEEPCISGRRGSGTIFFTHCNLACMFCQNADISQEGKGRTCPPPELARCMLSLAHQGCHNINLVTPSHVGPQILEALAIAVEEGLGAPLVWNSGGYDGMATLALFRGVVDVYMPDLKYSRHDSAARFSKAPDYPERAQEALREMYRQVGDLVTGQDGVALRGVLVRHLVLPGDAAGTEACLRFLREELSPRIGLSLLAQYSPRYKAWKEPTLARGLDPLRYRAFVRKVEELGFENVYVQRLFAGKEWFPDFNRKDPFEAAHKKLKRRGPDRSP